MSAEHKDRNNHVADLYKSGKTCPQIALMFSLSAERIRQILAVQGLNRKNCGSIVRVTKTAIQKSKKLEERNDRLLKKWGMTSDAYDAFSKKYGRHTSLSSPFRKYIEKRRASLGAGVQWNLSFLDWWQVWLDSGRWSERGRGNGFRMVRIDTSFPYETGNIRIVTGAEHITDIRSVERLRRAA